MAYGVELLTNGKTTTGHGSSKKKSEAAETQPLWSVPRRDHRLSIPHRPNAPIEQSAHPSRFSSRLTKNRWSRRSRDRRFVPFEIAYLVATGQTRQAAHGLGGGERCSDFDDQGSGVGQTWRRHEFARRARVCSSAAAASCLQRRCAVDFGRVLGDAHSSSTSACKDHRGPSGLTVVTRKPSTWSDAAKALSDRGQTSSDVLQ